MSGIIALDLDDLTGKSGNVNSLTTDLPSPRLFASEGLTPSTMVNWLPTPGIDMCSCKYLVISRRG